MKSLDGVVLVLLLQLVNAHHRYGTSKVGLALCGVTGHHHFLKSGKVIEFDFHTIGGLHCLCLETHIAKLQISSCIDLNDKIAIKISDCSLLRSYFSDRSAYQRFTVSLAHYSSRNLYRLR